jgi:putative glutamine amidotransferase
MPTKQVALEPGSHLARICGKSRIRVNSLHHQAIKTPGKGLKVVGRDLDGIVQAVETEGAHRIIGVQWHPEYLLYVPAQFALFRWLVRKEWG